MEDDRRTDRIRTLGQVWAFLDGSQPADFELSERASAYAFVRRTLGRVLGKPGKGLVKRYLEKVTGLSRPKSRVPSPQHCRTGQIRDHGRKPSGQHLPTPLHAP